MRDDKNCTVRAKLKAMGSGESESYSEQTDEAADGT